jgi:acetoin utilization protein AcuB
VKLGREGARRVRPQAEVTRRLSRTAARWLFLAVLKLRFQQPFRGGNMNKVADWMAKDLVTIDEDASIIEAVHLMKEREIRRLPVLKKGKLVGLVTDRMIKEYTPSKATSLDTWEIHYILSKTPVREAMNHHPYTVTPQDELTAAAQLINEKKLYGLCVVDDNGKLVGILTTTNILEALVAICGGKRTDS